MPRYLVTEIRAKQSKYVIDATDEDDAKHGRGDIIEEESDADDYTQEVLSIEEVEEDYEL